MLAENMLKSIDMKLHVATQPNKLCYLIETPDILNVRRPVERTMVNCVGR